MKILFYTILFLFAVNASGQSSKLLDRAEAYYFTRQYVKAISDYEKYFNSKNYNKSILHWADSYLKIGEVLEAEEVYKNYLEQFEFNDSLVVIYAGVLKQLNRYTEAKKWYLKVWEGDPQKKIFESYANYCDSAANSLKSSPVLEVKNLEHVNTRYSEIAPVVYDKNLVFSSNREETIIERKTANSKQPLFDLYLATGENSLSPDQVTLFSSELNTIHHECCATFTADYKKIFFTRSFDKPYSNTPGSKNPLKMYSAVQAGNKWDSLHTFIFNDTTRSYGHPSVESNEELFFFASDMEGGYGGTDIYVCFNVDGKWTDPINMGPFVNSAYNELYPFYHSDGTLYFSSNRPEGMGGYDIFSSSENEDGEYSLIKNMGWPVNSSANDISIFWNLQKDTGYLSSDRKGGEGMEDIYIIIDRKK